MTPHDPAFTAIAGGKATAVGEGLQTTCARPGCTEMFQQTGAPGRPALFHSPECRRQTHQERRVLRRRLQHHEDQARYLHTLMAAYERSTGDPDAEHDDQEDLAALPAAVVRAAEDAVVGMRSTARFLDPDAGEYAKELLDLFHAVEPVIEYHRRNSGR